MSGLRRLEVVYSGRVQGVGFRYTAQRIAAGYRVSGFVRNLADGHVDLVAEGPDGELNGFLEQLADAMSGYISESRSVSSDPTGEFEGFEIRY